ncbi:MAG: hypothetical protein IPO27_09275 [Bacteroidetes bacterium]|nr:hypothetical protein [Bacteroidota bacterium]
MFLIYTFYYTNRQTADIFRYYDDARLILQHLQIKPFATYDFLQGHFTSENYSLRVSVNNWENAKHSYSSNHVMIIMNAGLILVSAGDYLIQMMFFTFLSFVGLMALFKVFSKYSQTPPGVLFVLLFLLPSILFWTSGILKEALTIFGLGLMIFHFSKFISNAATYLDLIGIIAVMLMLAFLKFYVVLIVLPCLLILSIVRKLIKRHSVSIAWWFAGVSLFYLLMFLFSHYVGSINVLTALIEKRKAFIVLAQQMNAGSYFSTPDFSNYSQLIVALPRAFINTLLRPFSDWSNPFIVISAIENAVVLLLTLVAMYNRKKQTDLNLLCVSVVVAGFSLLGLIVPVEGALVRYKSIFLPFLMIWIADNIDLNAMASRYGFIKKIINI